MLKFRSVNIIFTVVFIGLLIALTLFKIPVFVFFVIGILWLLLTMMGSAFIQWNYHLKSLNSNPKTNKNQIAITFDDGPHPEFTSQVLELLKKYQAKATFFCIGKHIRTHPELFKTIVAEGHSVGNHTYSHNNNFGFLSSEKVISELTQTNAIAKKVSELEMNLYRPAFGVTNPRIKKALQITGLQSVGWNKRSLDTTSISQEHVLKRVTKNLKKGDIILLHDTSAKSVNVLEQLLLFLQQQEMEAVTIDSLFNIKAYA